MCRENSGEHGGFSSRSNIKEMVEEEKDGNSDILTGFTNFVDNNLRLFRVRIKKQKLFFCECLIMIIINIFYGYCSFIL